MSGQRKNPKPEASASAFRCGHVAIVGRPSVGKSTLLNALVGARIAITSKRPQTTRGALRGILTTDRAQFIFVDTPGFQTQHRSRLNERMNRAVRESLADVDVVVLVLEAGRLTDADCELIALLPSRVPGIAALNKIDRIADKRRLLPMLAEVDAAMARAARGEPASEAKRGSSVRASPQRPTLEAERGAAAQGGAGDFAAIVPISAEKSMELELLLAEIERHLPAGPALYPGDELTDRDERFLAAEFLREKIFRQLGEEVPYAAAVAIDSFKHEAALRRIHATVYVDKPGQRAILIGEGGARMKAIASAARADMERLFGGKVFLEVWVRVKSGWANDERMLAQLGY